MIEFQSHRIEISDTSLEVLEGGTGRAAFVCTHPYADTTGPHPGGGLTEAFGRLGRTFYVCPRGTGKSAPDPRREKLTMRQLVDDIEQVRIQLGIQRWVASGTSTGGMTALEYGVRYPQATSGLMLICTAPSYRFTESPDSLYNPENSVYQALEAMRLATGGGSEWRRSKLAASLHNRTVLDRLESYKRISPIRAEINVVEVLTEKWDFESSLDKIRAPTLIVAGRYDTQAGSLEPACLMLRKIADAELAVMNASGHFPYEEEPARFQHVISEFAARRLAAD